MLLKKVATTKEFIFTNVFNYLLIYIEYILEKKENGRSLPSNFLPNKQPRPNLSFSDPHIGFSPVRLPRLTFKFKHSFSNS